MSLLSHFKNVRGSPFLYFVFNLSLLRFFFTETSFSLTVDLFFSSPSGHSLGTFVLILFPFSVDLPSQTVYNYKKSFNVTKETVHLCCINNNKSEYCSVRPTLILSWDLHQYYSFSPNKHCNTKGTKSSFPFNKILSVHLLRCKDLIPHNGLRP